MDPPDHLRVTRAISIPVFKFLLRLLHLILRSNFYFLTVRSSYVNTLSVRSLNSHTTHVPISHLSSTRLINIPVFVSYFSLHFILCLSFTPLTFFSLFSIISVLLPHPYLLFISLLVCCYPPFCLTTYPIVCGALYSLSLWYVITNLSTVPFLHRTPVPSL